MIEDDIEHREGDIPRGELSMEPIRWRFVSNDLFAEDQIFLRDDEIKEAEEIFLKWIREK